MEECGPCPIFAGFTLAFGLQLRKKARKNLSQCSRRLAAGLRNFRPADKSCIVLFINSFCLFILSSHLRVVFHTTKPLHCFPHQNLYAFFISPMPATCLTPPFLVDLTRTKSYIMCKHCTVSLVMAAHCLLTLDSQKCGKVVHTSQECVKEFVLVFLISALGNTSVLIHYGSSWVGPRAGLNDLAKEQYLFLRAIDRHYTY